MYMFGILYSIADTTQFRDKLLSVYLKERNENFYF